MEKLRIVTPMLLSFLTIMASFNFFILQDISKKVDKLDDVVKAVSHTLHAHLGNPDLHYTTKKEIEWIKRSLKMKDAEASDK
jgi:hypothetical protein